jgi:muramoyltetrapeptide carboxypeptidase
VTLPVGAKVELLEQGRDVLIGWSHHHGQHGHHDHSDGHAHGHEHHEHGPRM